MERKTYLRISLTIFSSDLFETDVNGFSDLFPRGLGICGGGGDGGGSPPLDCGNYMGQGQCKSAADQSYDWCKNTVTDAAECRKAAEESSLAVAWEYYGESTTCYVLFDDILSENDVLRFCPSGYVTSNSGYTGTGYPVSVGTDTRYLCYSCKKP